MPRSVGTRSYPSVEPHTSARLAQASSLLFSAILGVVFAMAAALALYFAHGLDRAEQQQAQSLVQKSLGAAQRSLKLTVKDYAFWGDAYRHLHSTVDVEWAYVRENFGPALFEDFGFQGLFVVNPAGKTVYSVIDGQYQTVTAADWTGRPVRELARKARARAADEDALTLLTTLHGIPTLIGAAAITPGTDPTVRPDGGIASVMMMVKVLDPAKLDEMGQALGIPGLRVAVADDTSEPRVTLRAEHGEVIELQWQAARPGRRMILLVLPMIILAGCTIFLTTWVMSRRTSRAARALDGSHALLRSSQAALAMSESRFRDVAEASSDWIWEIDTEGRVTYLSDRFETVTGLPKQQWLGKHVDRLAKMKQGTLL
ncbi:MAG TPA: CHASE4 domain-containing protein, partial [Pseudomonas sp.]|uniref:CHASE4 domain-containing protein n=1 Tax=Pseudomonas sp. TaxID=306 RepID=UPI002B469AF0